MIREGRLISAPRLITGAVCDVPMRKFKIGICIMAPPPPLIVDKVKVGLSVPI